MWAFSDGPKWVSQDDARAAELRRERRLQFERESDGGEVPWDYDPIALAAARRGER